MVIPDNIQAVGNSIIVRRIPVNSPHEVKTQAGIIIQKTDDNDQNGYALGLVLSVGSKVTQIKKGDYLVFRSSITLALPNGLKNSVLYRMMESDQQIVGVIPENTTAEDFAAVQAGQGIE